MLLMQYLKELKVVLAVSLKWVITCMDECKAKFEEEILKNSIS